MKRYLWAAGLISLSLSVGSGPVLAQVDVQAELQKGASAMQAGQLDAAESALQKGYDAATAMNDQAKICQAAFQLGIVKTSLHKTAEAEKAFRTAMQIGKQVMPGNTGFQALATCLLADLLLTENKPSEAEPLYESAIPDLPKNVAALAPEKTINLALCYTRNDKLDLADKTFEKGIAAFTAVTGPDSVETVTSLANYATFQFERGHDDRAMELAQRVLKSKAQTKTVKAVANNVLAHVYDRQGQYGKAMHIAQESLTEFKKSGATDAVQEAGAMLLIGRIYKDGHKYREAESIIDKALAQLGKTAKDNPDYADAVREKGDLFIRQGQYEKAEILINLSKALREKYLGAEHSDVAQTLADLGYIDQQETKYGEAETSYKNALSIYKKTRGEAHPLYLSTLAKLGDLYKQMNKKAEAEKALTSILEIQRSSLPASSSEITSSIVSLASMYKDGGQAQKAEKLLTEAIERDKQSGADQARRASDLQTLASLQVAAGNIEGAAQTQKQADLIISALPGALSPGLSKAPPSSPTEAIIAAAVSPKSFARADISPAASTTTGEKWCLCVGISNFKDTSINLKYSAKDATDFKNFLIEKGHFKPDHVKLLVDENATRQNLIDQLGDGWLASKVKPDDLVMVFISSHGSQAMDEAHGVNFLVTYDTNKSSLLATGIPMQWLSKIIADQVKCKRTIIMLDVCHSGSAADWSDDAAESGGGASTSTAGNGTDSSAGAGAREGLKGLQRSLVSDPQAVVPGAGQIILCSSSKSQTSWESQEYPNGVFTKRLMEALNSQRAGFGDAYLPLKVSVESEVLRDRGQVQTPQISGSWKGSLLSPMSQ